MFLTCLGSSVRSLNFLGFLLLANLQPLKYILHEQPNENDAPQVSGSSPWHAQERLEKEIKTWQVSWQHSSWAWVFFRSVLFCYFFYNTEHNKGICEIHGLTRYFPLRKHSCVEGWLFSMKTVSSSPPPKFGTEIETVRAIEIQPCIHVDFSSWITSSALLLNIILNALVLLQQSH